MKCKLLPYQKDALPMIDSLHGRCLLADEMALGKTASSLAWLKSRKEIKKTLIVCPAHLKWHWRREAWNFFGLRSIIIGGQTPYKNFPSRPITIISYHVLQYWLKVLERKYFDLIIMDESHILSNPKAKWTRAAIKLAILIPYALALTGTPIGNRHIDIWSTLHILRPDIWRDMGEFGMKYCSVSRDRGEWKYKGSINGKQLHEELKKVMIRRTKKEVIKDLPPKTRYVIPLVIDMAEYRQMERDFQGWVKHYKPRTATPKTKMDGRVLAGHLLRLAANLKIPIVKEWIHSFFLESDSKLIMFAIQRIVLSSLHEEFGKRSVLVNGSVIGEKRQHSFDRFNTDPKCDLLLGNIQAAGTGWSAKKKTEIAFCQLAWRPDWHMQAEERAFGPFRGEGLPAILWYLIAQDTLEVDLLKLLKRKQRIIGTAIDGGKTIKSFDVFDELVLELQQRWKLI